MNAFSHKFAGSKERGASARTCIVTRAPRDPDDLIRFVLSPSDEVTPDLAGKLPGRGAWVTASRSAVAEAVRTNAFSRAFKTRAIAVPDLPERIDGLLETRAIQALSLANKAGTVVCGFGKVDDAITKGRASVIVHARDASQGGTDRLSRKFMAVCRETGQTPRVIMVFTIAQLALAMGRPNVVHAALNPGRATDAFMVAVDRLTSYRQPTATTALNADLSLAEPSAGRHDVGPETEEV